jgi:hypothetical protein
MRKILLCLVIAVLVACVRVTPEDARSIAYERLVAMSDGPSQRGGALKAALVVTEQSDGKYLVEWTDQPRNLLWAVIVLPSGEAEITRMAIDG